MKRLLDAFCRALEVLLVLLMAIMVVMVFGNVVLRYGFNSGITVSEELSRWMFVWVIFLGASIAVHEHAHMGSDFLFERLRPRAQKAVLVIGQLLMLWVTWLMLAGSLAQARINLDVEAPVTGLSQAWVDSAAVVFAVATGIMRLHDLWRILTGRLSPRTLIDDHHAGDMAEVEAEVHAFDADAPDARR